MFLPFFSPKLTSARAWSFRNNFTRIGIKLSARRNGRLCSAKIMQIRFAISLESEVFQSCHCQTSSLFHCLLLYAAWSRAWFSFWNSALSPAFLGLSGKEVNFIIIIIIQSSFRTVLTRNLQEILISFRRYKKCCAPDCVRSPPCILPVSTLALRQMSHATYSDFGVNSEFTQAKSCDPYYF